MLYSHILYGNRRLLRDEEIVVKKIFTLLTLVIFSTGLVAFDAEARRMGGGKSFGKQRHSLNQQAPRPAQPPASAPSPAGGSKWGGALAGLAAGGLLAALFMGGAFEGLNMMDILMFSLLIGGVFFVMRMMRKPQAAASRPMQFSGLNANDNVNTPPIQSLDTTTASGSSRHQGNIPADFKVAPFLRNAKVSFIRLQAAHDAGDINDIREYTTSEMLAEISMDINEYGLNQKKTEVMSIDADLLDVETTDDLAVASVRFNGQLRQGSEGEPEDFDETWYVQKDLKDADSVWLLAGIQQVAASDEE